MSLIGPYFANTLRRSSDLVVDPKFRMYNEVFGGRAYLLEDIAASTKTCNLVLILVT